MPLLAYLRPPVIVGGHLRTSWLISDHLKIVCDHLGFISTLISAPRAPPGLPVTILAPVLGLFHAAGLHGGLNLLGSPPGIACGLGSLSFHATRTSISLRRQIFFLLTPLPLIGGPHRVGLSIAFLGSISVPRNSWWFLKSLAEALILVLIQHMTHMLILVCLTPHLFNYNLIIICLTCQLKFGHYTIRPIDI